MIIPPGLLSTEHIYSDTHKYVKLVSSQRWYHHFSQTWWVYFWWHPHLLFLNTAQRNWFHL
jgi:hypothetical protein